MAEAKTVADVIAGEAVSGTPQERWNDMVHIASVIANRAAMLGVTPQEVVSVQSQFNAYNKAMPAGTAAMTGLAEQAMQYVEENGPVTDATFYATPAATDNLPSGLAFEAETTGHQYFSDPAMRAINTSAGLRNPNPENLPSAQISQDPLQAALSRPYTANGLTNGVTSLTDVPANAVTSQSIPASAIDPAFSPNGFLAGQVAAPFSNVPASLPTMNSFADLAAANPMAVTQNLPANASLGTPDLSASATVPGGILSNVPATGENWAALGLEASAKVNPVEVASVNERMGVPAPVSTTYGDMAEAGPLAAPVDVTAQAAAKANPGLAASAGIPWSASLFSPAVANTPSLTSFAEEPTAENPFSSVLTPAQPTMATTPSLNSFADLATAEPISAPMSVTPSGILGATPSLSANATVPAQSGIYSPEHQQLAANANANLAEMQSAARPATVTAPVNSFADLAEAGPVTAGILSNPAVAAQATPSLSTASNAGILGSNLLSANPLENATSPFAGAFSPSFAASVTAPVSGYAPQNDFFANEPVAEQSSVNIAQDPAVSMPNLETVTVPDQPAVATIDGPTNNPAVNQQAKVNTVTANTPAFSGQFPAAPEKTGLLGGTLNKGMVTGGILGSLAAGPIGGILGGLLGNQINKQGGLGGILGSQSPMSITQVPGTLANISSIYNGVAPAGTQTIASNGSTITAQPGGWTTVTNKYGVTESVSPWGGYAGYFGPDPNKPDADAGDNAGYDSPGLF